VKKKEREVLISRACTIRDRAQASIALGKLSRQKDFAEVAIMAKDITIACLAAERVFSIRYLKKISAKSKSSPAIDIAERKLYSDKLSEYDL
jgi:hypothetical protein